MSRVWLSRAACVLVGLSCAAACGAGPAETIGELRRLEQAFQQVAAKVAPAVVAVQCMRPFRPGQAGDVSGPLDGG
ncbi:MAG: hypothetical protein ACE5K7_05105, partial [Phycisphaerae bacterium]